MTGRAVVSSSSEAREVFFDGVRARYPQLSADPLASDAFPTSFTSSGGPNLANEVLLGESWVGAWHRGSLVQPCLRYWDIDAVGDGTHLSYFEMAVLVAVNQGRREICGELLKLLCHPGFGFAIDRDRLWATVFGGGPIHGKEFAPDHEAYRIWCELGIAEQRIVSVDGSEGFVANRHEAVGGYRTELYFDRVGECSGECCRCLPACSRCDRFLEVGTSVAYDCAVDLEGTDPVRRITSPSVYAAGVGLERVLQVVAGASSIARVGLMAELTDAALRQPRLPRRGDQREVVVASSRIADHLRALAALACSVGLDFPGRSNKQRRPIVNRYYRRLYESLMFLTGQNRCLAQTVTERVLGVWLDSSEAESWQVEKVCPMDLCHLIWKRAEKLSGGS